MVLNHVTWFSTFKSKSLEVVRTTNTLPTSLMLGILQLFFMFKANGSPSVRKCNGCQTERPTRHNATVRLKRGSTSSSTSPGNRTPPRTNVTNITDKNYKTKTNKQRPQTNKKKHNGHNNNKTSKTDKGILSIWRTRGSPVDRLIQHKVLVCQIRG